MGCPSIFPLKWSSCFLVFFNVDKLSIWESGLFFDYSVVAYLPTIVAFHLFLLVLATDG
ncbi:15911_t:CDS:2 [Acaulospora morrowiae]|uniref:15911_t:CDS:1 n=1 Tax=Acaulospora morrowiae TaxID=94023 RepID=A0A9N8V6G6_9GLOM|nr:15911_t:CDS:2 [Acaulospora morrowiae]